MDDVLRATILRHIDGLVETTSFSLFTKRCVQHGIMTQKMIDYIVLKEQNDYARHIGILIKITKRGPLAYQKLLEICQVDFPHAHNLLKPNSYLGQTIGIHDNALNTIHTNNSQLVPFDRDTNNPLLLKIVKSDRFHGAQSGEVFAMRSRNRGVLFLVNNIRFEHDDMRRGAEYDRDNLITLFRAFGFTIFYHENATTKEFLRLVDKLIESEILKSADCLVFALLSHGNYEDGKTTAIFSDSISVDIEHLVKKFSDQNCPALYGKLKMFIFSVCRGPKADMGVERVDNINENKLEGDGMAFASKVDVETFSDIMICHATVPGFRAHRETLRGTWFICELCKVWSENAHNCTVEELMIIVICATVSLRTSEMNVQTPSYECIGVSKDLYFNPGYFGV